MSTMWNLWHGCTKVSAGCRHCYVYRRDAEFGKDSSIVTKTKAFDLPIRKNRKGEYKVRPEDGVVYTCFTSDFFHPDADEWRKEAWSMMHTRADLDFFFITKRPERFHVNLPENWGDGYPNVHICCTCENQYMADKRLPIFLELPIRHKSIIHEPMLGPINIERFLEKYGKEIDQVVCGGESGDEARLCDYAWVMDTMCQCVKYEVPFHFKQTGANFKRGEQIYHIPRKDQQEQAEKAKIDYMPPERIRKELYENEEQRYPDLYQLSLPL